MVIIIKWDLINGKNIAACFRIISKNQQISNNHARAFFKSLAGKKGRSRLSRISDRNVFTMPWSLYFEIRSAYFRWGSYLYFPHKGLVLFLVLIMRYRFR